MAYDWRKEEYEVTRPGRTRIDYRQEIGRAHIPIGVEREFSVLDPDRADRAPRLGEHVDPGEG